MIKWHCMILQNLYCDLFTFVTFLARLHENSANFETQQSHVMIAFEPFESLQLQQKMPNVSQCSLIHDDGHKFAQNSSQMITVKES